MKPEVLDTLPIALCSGCLSGNECIVTRIVTLDHSRRGAEHILFCCNAHCTRYELTGERLIIGDRGTR